MLPKLPMFLILVLFSLGVVKCGVLPASESPMLMKILEAVDVATSDEHLFDATLQLLKSLCICMREALEAKKEQLQFIGDSNSLHTDDFSSNEIRLEIYKKIYNHTCFELRNELADKLQRSKDGNEEDSMDKSKANHDTNYVNNMIEKNIKNLDIQAHFEKLMYKTLIETKELHSYTIKRSNLLRKPGIKNDISQQNLIIIISLSKIKLKQSSKESEEVDYDDVNEIITSNNSRVEIDIFNTKFYDVNLEKNSKLTNLSACNLQSLYKFLVEKKRDKKINVIKLFSKTNYIKIYMDVTANISKNGFLDTCCNNNTQLCEKRITRNYFDSEKDFKRFQHQVLQNYKKTITKIKNLVKLYDYKTKVQETYTKNINSTTDSECIGTTEIIRDKSSVTLQNILNTSKKTTNQKHNISVGKSLDHHQIPALIKIGDNDTTLTKTAGNTISKTLFSPVLPLGLQQRDLILQSQMRDTVGNDLSAFDSLEEHYWIQSEKKYNRNNNKTLESIQLKNRNNEIKLFRKKNNTQINGKLWNEDGILTEHFPYYKKNGSKTDMSNTILTENYLTKTTLYDSSSFSTVIKPKSMLKRKEMPHDVITEKQLSTRYGELQIYSNSAEIKSKSTIDKLPIAQSEEKIMKLLITTPALKSNSTKNVFRIFSTTESSLVNHALTLIFKQNVSPYLPRTPSTLADTSIIETHRIGIRNKTLVLPSEESISKQPYSTSQTVNIPIISKLAKIKSGVDLAKPMIKRHQNNVLKDMAATQLFTSTLNDVFLFSKAHNQHLSKMNLKEASLRDHKDDDNDKLETQISTYTSEQSALRTTPIAVQTYIPTVFFIIKENSTNKTPILNNKLKAVISQPLLKLSTPRTLPTTLMQKIRTESSDEAVHLMTEKQTNNARPFDVKKRVKNYSVKNDDGFNYSSKNVLLMSDKNTVNEIKTSTSFVLTEKTRIKKNNSLVSDTVLNVETKIKPQRNLTNFITGISAFMTNKENKTPESPVVNKYSTLMPSIFIITEVPLILNSKESTLSMSTAPGSQNLSFVNTKRTVNAINSTEKQRRFNVSINEKVTDNTHFDNDPKVLNISENKTNKNRTISEINDDKTASTYKINNENTISYIPPNLFKRISEKLASSMISENTVRTEGTIKLKNRTNNTSLSHNIVKVYPPTHLTIKILNAAPTYSSKAICSTVKSITDQFLSSKPDRIPKYMNSSFKRNINPEKNGNTISNQRINISTVSTFIHDVEIKSLAEPAKRILGQASWTFTKSINTTPKSVTTIDSIDEISPLTIIQFTRNVLRPTKENYSHVSFQTPKNTSDKTQHLEPFRIPENNTKTLSYTSTKKSPRLPTDDHYVGTSKRPKNTRSIMKIATKPHIAFGNKTQSLWFFDSMEATNGLPFDDVTAIILKATHITRSTEKNGNTSTNISKLALPYTTKKINETSVSGDLTKKHLNLLSTNKSKQTYSWMVSDTTPNLSFTSKSEKTLDFTKLHPKSGLFGLDPLIQVIKNQFLVSRVTMPWITSTENLTENVIVKEIENITTYLGDTSSSATTKATTKSLPRAFKSMPMKSSPENKKVFLKTLTNLPIVDVNKAIVPNMDAFRIIKSYPMTTEPIIQEVITAIKYNNFYIPSKSRARHFLKDVQISTTKDGLAKTFKTDVSLGNPMSLTTLPISKMPSTSSYITTKEHKHSNTIKHLEITSSPTEFNSQIISRSTENDTLKTKQAPRTTIFVEKTTVSIPKRNLAFFLNLTTNQTLKIPKQLSITLNTDMTITTPPSYKVTKKHKDSDAMENLEIISFPMKRHVEKLYDLNTNALVTKHSSTTVRQVPRIISNLSVKIKESEDFHTKPINRCTSKILSTLARHEKDNLLNIHINNSLSKSPGSYTTDIKNSIFNLSIDFTLEKPIMLPSFDTEKLKKSTIGNDMNMLPTQLQPASKKSDYLDDKTTKSKSVHTTKTYSSAHHITKLNLRGTTNLITEQLSNLLPIGTNNPMASGTPKYTKINPDKSELLITATNKKFLETVKHYLNKTNIQTLPKQLTWWSTKPNNIRASPRRKYSAEQTLSKIVVRSTQTPISSKAHLPRKITNQSEMSVIKTENNITRISIASRIVIKATTPDTKISDEISNSLSHSATQIFISSTTNHPGNRHLRSTTNWYKRKHENFEITPRLEISRNEIHNASKSQSTSTNITEKNAKMASGPFAFDDEFDRSRATNIDKRPKSTPANKPPEKLQSFTMLPIIEGDLKPFTLRNISVPVKARNTKNIPTLLTTKGKHYKNNYLINHNIPSTTISNTTENGLRPRATRVKESYLTMTTTKIPQSSRSSTKLFATENNQRSLTINETDYVRNIIITNITNNTPNTTTSITDNILSTTETNIKKGMPTTRTTGMTENIPRFVKTSTVENIASLGTTFTFRNISSFISTNTKDKISSSTNSYNMNIPSITKSNIADDISQSKYSTREKNGLSTTESKITQYLSSLAKLIITEESQRALENNETDNIPNTTVTVITDNDTSATTSIISIPSPETTGFTENNPRITITNLKNNTIGLLQTSTTNNLSLLKRTIDKKYLLSLTKISYTKNIQSSSQISPKEIISSTTDGIKNTPSLTKYKVVENKSIFVAMRTMPREKMSSYSTTSNIKDISKSIKTFTKDNISNLTKNSSINNTHSSRITTATSNSLNSSIENIISSDKTNIEYNVSRSERTDVEETVVSSKLINTPKHVTETNIINDISSSTPTDLKRIKKSSSTTITITTQTIPKTTTSNEDKKLAVFQTYSNEILKQDPYFLSKVQTTLEKNLMHASSSIDVKDTIFLNLKNKHQHDLTKQVLPITSVSRAVKEKVDSTANIITKSIVDRKMIQKKNVQSRIATAQKAAGTDYNGPDFPRHSAKEENKKNDTVLPTRNITILDVSHLTQSLSTGNRIINSNKQIAHKKHNTTLNFGGKKTNVNVHQKKKDKNKHQSLHEFTTRGSIVKHIALHLIPIIKDQNPSKTGNVTDWWLDDMYLKVRLPLPINSNPGMVFPRRHFAKMEEVADLGALFIDDLLDYKEMLDRGELPLERATSREKGQPLCMEQFYRLLGVCRIPEVGRDRLEFPPVRDNADEGEELVVAACRNYFYPIPVKAVDRGRLTAGEIQAQLLHCMVDAAGAPPAPRVGLLTSMNRDHWARARETLIKDENNRTNLELISRSLCILCLDEAGGDRADTNADTNAMLRAMHGAGTRYHSANRWFDKTVQLIISQDGTVGMCYEHSAAEGVAVVRVAERALARAEVADRPAPPPALLPAPPPMKWNIPPDVHRTIEQAARDLDRAISDLDHSVYTYRGYGREFMKSCRTSPDVYIQLALQYAYYKMYGYLVTTYESASLRRFRNGRVDNIRSAHGAAHAWAAAMCTAETPPLNEASDDGQKKVSFNLYGEQKKLELFEEAARKQTEIMEANILGRGIDNHLLGLRETARETLGELPPLFTDATYKQMIDYKLSTSQVATTTEGTFMGYGAVVPDGYGCSYNPKRDCVIFCISSFSSSSVTSTEAFRQSLEEALNSMQLMFQARKGEV